MTGAEVIREFEQAAAERKPLEQLWKECYQYTHPIRGIQFNGDVFAAAEQSQSQAKSLTANIFDSTAPDSCRTLASALVSGMTPANYLWFGWKVDEDVPKDDQDWLDSSAEKIHKEIHSSNFDAPNYESMLDVAEAGMAALYIEEGEDTTYNFEQWPLYSCFFASSRRGGMIDTVYRPFTMTALQAVNEYGEAAVPERVRDLALTKPQTLCKFVRMIAPRRAKDLKGTAKEKLQPFESITVYYDSKRIVARKGYHEFPVPVPRWLKVPNSVYAQGPMADALPDTKTLNELERVTLAGADMAINGMWGALNDGVLNPKTVRVGARRIVFMQNKDSFFPLTPGGRFDLSAIKSEDKRKSIRRVLMADILESATPGPAKTATEWHYRMNLIRQLLGPTFGRLQSEYLQQIVARCFGIALRKGLLGTPPESLRNRNLHLRYISPLARAAQNEELTAMEHHEQGLIATSGAVPDVLDTYDWDAAARKKAELAGVPTVLIFDVDKVDKKRKDRAEARAQAEQKQLQMAAAMKGKGPEGLAA